jgi:hypothetical protein
MPTSKAIGNYLLDRFGREALLLHFKNQDQNKKK